MFEGPVTGNIPEVLDNGEVTDGTHVTAGQLALAPTPYAQVHCGVRQQRGQSLPRNEDHRCFMWCVLAHCLGVDELDKLQRSKTTPSSTWPATPERDLSALSAAARAKAASWASSATTPVRSVLDFESFAGRGQMLDGRVLGASQVEYRPFGKPPLKREVGRRCRRPGRAR